MWSDDGEWMAHPRPMPKWLFMVLLAVAEIGVVCATVAAFMWWRAI